MDKEIKRMFFDEETTEKIDGKNANEWFNLGREAFVLGRKKKDIDKYLEAKNCYYKALALDPNESIKEIIAGDLEQIMFFGYLIEPIYLWLLRDRQVITESESTKKDLVRFGFKSQNIKVIPIGIEINPISDLQKIEKYKNPTIISLGSIRAMKRTDQIIKAFELAKKEIPNLQLLIAGDMIGNYGLKIKKMIHDSQYTDSIHYLGKIDKNKKIEIMQKAHLLIVTSVKEGWCIVVTEANSQGTPAVAYNADGLRDSVKHNQTGLVCIKNSTKEIAKNIIELLEDKQKYKKISSYAWLWSKKFNFDFSYKTFIVK